LARREKDSEGERRCSNWPLIRAAGCLAGGSTDVEVWVGLIRRIQKENMEEITRYWRENRN
jgi:hypothetical protein